MIPGIVSFRPGYIRHVASGAGSGPRPKRQSQRPATRTQSYPRWVALQPSARLHTPAAHIASSTQTGCRISVIETHYTTTRGWVGLGDSSPAAGNAPFAAAPLSPRLGYWRSVLLLSCPRRAMWRALRAHHS
eukprot:scaffold2416_cov102-Isochrysis_galbana.AAC.1